jgi:hypothetical protein
MEVTVFRDYPEVDVASLPTFRHQITKQHDVIFLKIVMKQAEKIYPLNICETDNSGSVPIGFQARPFVMNDSSYSEIQARVLINMHLLVRVKSIPS